MKTFCKIVDGVVVDRAVFDGAIPADWPDRADWRQDAVSQIGWTYDGLAFAPPPPPPVDLPTLRTAALVSAMAYGNAITGQITSGYAEAEVLSWDAQEREARIVAAGGDLPAQAMLPGLAEDAGQTVADYAAGVIAKADQFRAIARAAVHLRRAAKAAIMDQAIETPEHLEAAVAALRAEADALAAGLIGDGA